MDAGRDLVIEMTGMSQLSQANNPLITAQIDGYVTNSMIESDHGRIGRNVSYQIRKILIKECW